VNWLFGYLLASQKLVHGLASLCCLVLFYCSENLFFSTSIWLKMCTILLIFIAKFKINQIPCPLQSPLFSLTLKNFYFPQSFGSRWNMLTTHISVEITDNAFTTVPCVTPQTYSASTLLSKIQTQPKQRLVLYLSVKLQWFGSGRKQLVCPL